MKSINRIVLAEALELFLLRDRFGSDPAQHRIPHPQGRGVSAAPSGTAAGAPAEHAPSEALPEFRSEERRVGKECRL